MKQCLFCDKDNFKEHRIIFENELFYARWDNFPINKGHAEIVPKKHIVSFFDLSEKELVQMFDLLKRTKQLIEEKYHPDGYNIGINDGRAAGRTIDHLHVHIIPRYFGDVANPKGGVRNIIPEKGDYTFPYLPRGRKILYVSADNEFMREATKMLAHSGCIKQPTAAVVVEGGRIIGRGVNAGRRVDVCPRVVHKCPTGTGYEFCKTVCKQKGHAEVMAIRDVLKKGNDSRGASLYLDGHWWVCKPCWDEIIKAGISRVFLQKDSIKLYKK